MSVSMLGQPFGASQMALPGTVGARMLARRIDMEHQTRYLFPIRPFGVGLKDAQIGDEVLFVIASQNIGIRSDISHRGIERRLGHEASYAPNRMIVPRDNTDAPLTIAISVIFRQQPAGCGGQCVRPPRLETSPNWLEKPVNDAIPDCRAYSVVKCTTRRSPRVYGHKRGLRSQFTEGPECARPVSGSVGS